MENQSKAFATEFTSDEEVLCEPSSNGKITCPAYVGQTSHEVNIVQTDVLSSDYCKTSWIRPKLDIPNLNRVHFYNTILCMECRKRYIC